MPIVAKPATVASTQPRMYVPSARDLQLYAHRHTPVAQYSANGIAARTGRGLSGPVMRMVSQPNDSATMFTPTP